jgi:hypothetical protein
MPRNRPKGDKAQQPATNRPKPGSLPPLDPASPTIHEIRFQEALQGKKQLTKLPKKTKRKGNPNWVKGVIPDNVFKKGHTIQPTPEQRRLRPKPVQDIIKMFQQAAPEAFEALKRALLDPKLTVTAANSILDRGYGKPTQQVEITGKDGNPLKAINVNMSAEEAARLYADTIAAGALPGAAVRQLAHDSEEVIDPENDPD